MAATIVPGFSQYLRITPEATYGTYASANAAEAIWIRLTGDNSFTPQKTIYRQTLRSADTYNRRAQAVFNPGAGLIKYSVAAGLNLPLWPSQAGFFMTAAGVTSGGLAGSPPQLTSYTFDFFNGITGRRFLGGMCGSLDVSSDAEGQTANLATQWVFQKVDDAALNPVGTNFASTGATYPSEVPFVHTELTGQFTVGGVAISNAFDQFHLSVKNTLVHGFFDQNVISFCQWAGRDVDLMSHMTCGETTLRDDYEAQTALALEATYYRGATKKLVLNFETVSLLQDRNEAHPLGGVVTQGFTANAFYDSGATTDFLATATYS